jgi:cellulose synthase/poly-beta-1,6-N-acetylglucosamine synthase-like glycosyltransferase
LSSDSETEKSKEVEIESEVQDLFLEFFFLFSRFVAVLYMFRHYVFSFAAIKHRSEHRHGQCAVFQPYVSIIIPARNEEKVIGRLLRRLTELKYPKNKLEIIVMDDQSTDRTGEIAELYASKNPSLIRVIHRKVGGVGKAAVLNEGLQQAHGEIVGFFDADYVPKRNILEKMLPYFLDSSVGVVQGRVFVLNERQSLVSRIVALERLGGYRVNQYARDLFGLIPQFAGTVGFIRRDLLLALGGFNPDTLAEDTDLTFRIVLAGFQIKYVNFAESGEEAVKGWHQYWRQRKRWAKGHMQCAFNYVFPLLKSPKISLKRKMDGLLLLNVYFLPILVMMSWMLLFVVLIFKLHTSIPFEIAFVSSVFFILHGNLAPFIEVMAGALCDKRWKLILFTWLLVLSYFINMVVCSIAFLELLACRINGKNPNHWHKTMHDGEG